MLIRTQILHLSFCHEIKDAKPTETKTLNLTEMQILTFHIVVKYLLLNNILHNKILNVHKIFVTRLRQEKNLL